MTTIDEKFEGPITLAELNSRDKFKVKVRHYRRASLNYYCYSNDHSVVLPSQGYYTSHQVRINSDLTLESKGGKTVVEIILPAENVGLIGIARCNDTDFFDKKFGVKLAIARALGETEEEERLLSVSNNRK